jgi:hypothetical protein
MTALLANFSLQLIVESFSTGAKQASVCNDSLKLIVNVIPASEGAATFLYILGDHSFNETTKFTVIHSHAVKVPVTSTNQSGPFAEQPIAATNSSNNIFSVTLDSHSASTTNLSAVLNLHSTNCLKSNQSFVGEYVSNFQLVVVKFHRTIHQGIHESPSNDPSEIPLNDPSETPSKSSHSSHHSQRLFQVD